MTLSELIAQVALGEDSRCQFKLKKGASAGRKFGEKFGEEFGENFLWRDLPRRTNLKHPGFRPSPISVGESRVPPLPGLRLPRWTPHGCR